MSLRLQTRVSQNDLNSGAKQQSVCTSVGCQTLRQRATRRPGLRRPHSIAKFRPFETYHRAVVQRQAHAETRISRPASRLQNCFTEPSAAVTIFRCHWMSLIRSQLREGPTGVTRPESVKYRHQRSRTAAVVSAWAKRSHTTLGTLLWTSMGMATGSLTTALQQPATASKGTFIDDAVKLSLCQHHNKGLAHRCCAHLQGNHPALFRTHGIAAAQSHNP